MTTRGAPVSFEVCRARVDELLDARADMELVERTIDACMLDRDARDALWLWASGSWDRRKRQPSPRHTEGVRDDEFW